MIHRSDEFDAAITARVETIEALTDADVVVVAASRSGNYADRRFLVATALSFVALGILIEIPTHVPPLWVMIDLLLTWFALAWILDADPILSRLVGKSRKEREVHQAAAAEFHREGVHSTPNRLGILVYVSSFEGKVELIPDIGLQARIPEGRWANARSAFRHDDLAHFLVGLDAVGVVLANHVPRTGDKEVDLPNAPRVRS